LHGISESQTQFHIVPLKLDEVQPPDHVDGLRMEQDGQLNPDYKKEILIGNHEEFEHGGSEKKLLSRLKVVFVK
jgi:calcium-binding protein